MSMMHDEDVCQNEIEVEMEGFEAPRQSPRQGGVSDYTRIRRAKLLPYEEYLNNSGFVGAASLTEERISKVLKGHHVSFSHHARGGRDCPVFSLGVYGCEQTFLYRLRPYVWELHHADHGNVTLVNVDELISTLVVWSELDISPAQVPASLIAAVALAQRMEWTVMLHEDGIVELDLVEVMWRHDDDGRQQFEVSNVNFYSLEGLMFVLHKVYDEHRAPLKSNA